MSDDIKTLVRFPEERIGAELLAREQLCRYSLEVGAEIKGKSRVSHGGKRQGAGRKSNEVNELRQCVAQGLLTADEEREQWLKYLNSDDPALALKAFLAWNDPAYGKPAQAVDVTSRDEGITRVIVNL